MKTKTKVKAGAGAQSEEYYDDYDDGKIQTSSGS